MSGLYITTTLPYANAAPHVRHALEFLQADAFARYFRRKLGHDRVFFNLGIDEHGLKVLCAAQNAGQTPQEFVDTLAEKWVDFCGKFRVQYDSFYRTSRPSHHSAAQRAWIECRDRGDIYRKQYSGLYCVGCEAFVLERDLRDGRCPDHNTVPVVHSEENYFFRLSRYSDRILESIRENEDFLQPVSRVPELVHFLRNMEDISISRQRQRLPWGVPVPGDPDQVMYVWFDALINYIAAVGYPDDRERLCNWWPGIQLCGPDNLRFQGGIWQALLASLGLPFTKKLLVHGTVLGPGGQKMSKTVGNVVAPLEQFDKYGVDVCRYYLLGVLKTYGDCVYSETELRDTYHVRLSNNFGNLVSRLIHLAGRKGVTVDEGECDPEFRESVAGYTREIEAAYEDYRLSDAVSGVDSLITMGNRYFQEKEPWNRGAGEAARILNNVALLLLTACDLYEPVIPVSAQKARTAIRAGEKVVLFPRLS